jgi:fatty acid-binding protein DegV
MVRIIVDSSCDLPDELLDGIIQNISKQASKFGSLMLILKI